MTIKSLLITALSSLGILAACTEKAGTPLGPQYTVASTDQVQLVFAWPVFSHPQRSGYAWELLSSASGSAVQTGRTTATTVTVSVPEPTARIEYYVKVSWVHARNGKLTNFHTTESQVLEPAVPEPDPEPKPTGVWIAYSGPDSHTASSRVLQAGDSVGGDLYVEYRPDVTSISSVRFFVNSSATVRERAAPYTLNGDDYGILHPFDSRKLTNGDLALEARVEESDGVVVETSTLTLQLANSAAEPEPSLGKLMIRHNNQLRDLVAGETIAGDVYIEWVSTQTLGGINWYFNGKYIRWDHKPPLTLGGDAAGDDDGTTLFDTRLYPNGPTTIVVSILPEPGATEAVDILMPVVVENVAAPPPPPPPTPTPGAITLTVRRLAGGSGTVFVSSGVPLVPGQYFGGAVRLLAGDGERAAYIAPLHGKHADGSFISVLVQADAQNGEVLSLEIGTAQAKTRSAVVVDFRPTADPKNPGGIGYPNALFETPVAHSTAWVSSLFGQTPTVDQNKAAGGTRAKFESDWMSWQQVHWDRYVAAGENYDSYAGSNYYDRSLHHMVWWLRGAPVEVARRGMAYAFGNRYYYYERNNWGIAGPRMWNIEGMALHYWLTGDPVSREPAQRFGTRAWGSMPKMSYCNYEGEPRWTARSLQSIVWAHRLGWTDADWADRSRQYVNSLLSAETYVTDPSSYKYGAWDFLHPDYPTGARCSVKYVSNFMNAMILDAMVSYVEHVNPSDRSRVATTVARTLAYFRNSQWVVSSGSPSIQYYDVHLEGSGGPDPAVDLNGFYIHMFKWSGRHADAGDLFDTLSKWPDGSQGPWLTGGKQFNEAYWKSWLY
jgi:hypothetical protein